MSNEKISFTDKIGKKIDDKLKLKTIFAGYILTTIIYLGSMTFLEPLDLTDTKQFYFVLYIWITLIVSVLIYLVGGKQEFKQEDIKDEVKYNKRLRDPKTLKEIIANEFIQIKKTLEMEESLNKIKSDTKDALSKLNPTAKGDPLTELSVEEIEEQIKILKESEE